MQLHSISNFTQSSRNVWLYSAVYTGKISAYAVLFLFVSFLIQPIHQALANEAASVPEVVTEEVSPEPEILPDVAEIQNDTTVNQESVEQASGSNQEVSSDENESDETAEQVNNLDEIEEDISSDPMTNASSDLESELSSTTTSETTEDNSASTTTSVNQQNANASTSNPVDSDLNNSSSTSTSNTPGSTSSSNDDVVSDSSNNQDDANTDANENQTELDSALAESSNNNSEAGEETSEEDEIIAGGVNDIVKEVVTLTRQLVTEENYYQFSRQSCAPVGDGTFHCTTKTTPDIDSQSVVYADRDDSGRMQIFMKTSKGKVEQITDNEFDNTSPDFDAESMRIVWQQLIDGRYQIMSYDLNDKKTTQLTYSRTNSMEPKVSADGIVWQTWDGTDWEILFFDGKFTDQITDNETQDVTPVIEDGYILWSILGGENQEARVYSIASKETMTIKGHEGGAVANPRFVLVYDTKFDNGDVVTQGFDPVTGLSAPISAKPASEPIDIPETDPIGEIRALIQNKSTTTKEQKVVSGPTGDNSSTTDSYISDGGSTTTANTLILKTVELGDDEEDEEEDTAPTAVDAPEFELTEYDLVITNEATSSTSSRPSVYDIDMSANSTGTASSTQS